MEVWPDNAEPLALFVGLHTQWAWLAGGMGGGARMGLRYEAVYPMLDRASEGDQEAWNALFADVRAMEMAVLQIPLKR